MKSILLTTTALVAFAGVAAADGHTGITFTGNTEFGFNDNDPDSGDVVINDDEQGFYWNTDIDVTMSAELDNGLTASTSFELDIVADDGNTATVFSDEWVASLESANGSLFIGDTSFAAETLWNGAGDMEADAFSEADGESAIRADFSVSDIEASVSYVLTDAGQVAVNTLDPDEEVDQLSIGAAGDFGMFSFALAYQEESIAETDGIQDLPYDPGDFNGDFNTDEIFAIAGGVSVGGADITLAYAENTTAEEQSVGIEVSYPLGPVTATGYFVDESDTVTQAEIDAAIVAGDPAPVANEDPNFGINLAYSQGPISVEFDYQDDQTVEKWALEGSYEVGNGLAVFAGVLNDNEGDDEDFYVAATYDLGAGAELLVSYAEDSDGDNEDEIGADEYQAGTTVELSFAF